MKIKYVIFTLLALISPFAMAHSGHIGNHGFESGLMHPLTGIDHLSVMISVGLLAALFGKSFRWIMPVAFVLCMIVGGILGVTGIVIPYVEAGIILSVVIMGMMLFRGNIISHKVVIGFVSLFAIFHGMAHGAEMPLDSHALYYFSGFVLSTSLLHLSGIILGEMILSFSAHGRFTKAIGAVIALLGYSMIFS
ncbi:HupE / UreJ protein [Vibrio aerogenes CECT 7868]|uniref:HupE / UreJ protein n=2 Tax=Vibrio aerogenes TaxID=92172 RepID=A0A1M5YN39_9VIBR|nr:HupE / UreJ protein [Vibrio aerogenes CECT 7868]